MTSLHVSSQLLPSARQDGALTRPFGSTFRLQSTYTRTRGLPALAPARECISRRRVVTQSLFGIGKKPKVVAPTRETIVPKPSFNIPAVLLGVAGLSAFEGNSVLAGITGVLGAFLAIQATRVRFRFEPDALEVVIGKEEASSENSFVGGENRWKYDTFTNWEFWWPGFPVLVYFKETQTKPEGQIHFFPLIFDGKAVYDVMLERCGPTQTSGPKK